MEALQKSYLLLNYYVFDQLIAVKTILQECTIQNLLLRVRSYDRPQLWEISRSQEFFNGNLSQCRTTRVPLPLPTLYLHCHVLFEYPFHVLPFEENAA